ncbi:HAD family hydrolase [Candidatus Uhrbacteria bacterium]|nr:HAD family hydrolase [Candidatus Uhrbacteria bacterium]
MSARRLVIFDWNGTLQDDVDLYFEYSVRRVFARYGLPCPSFATYREEMTGATFMDFYWSRGIPRSLTIDALFEQSRREIIADGRTAEIFPEVRDVLVRLTERGCLVAVVSMAPTVEIVEGLVGRGIHRHLDFIQGDARNGKGDVFMQCLERLDVRPKDAIAVGDLVDDAIAAQTAGVKPLLCPRGYHSRERIESARGAIPTMSVIETLDGVFDHV